MLEDIGYYFSILNWIGLGYSFGLIHMLYKTKGKEEMSKEKEEINE